MHTYLHNNEHSLGIQMDMEKGKICLMIRK